MNRIFTSRFSKIAVNETEELCLFLNPTGSNVRIKELFLDLRYTSECNSTWEFYHNPTITNNGTIQIATDVNGGAPTNKASLYASPTVTSFGLPLRKFMIQTNKKKFCSRVPMIVLEPGNSILVRRLKQGTGTMTPIWTWTEPNPS